MTRSRTWTASAAVVSVLCASLLVSSCGGGGGGSPSVPGLVTIQTIALPGGLTGDPYSAGFTAEFPHPPGTFAVVGGQLPLGITLDLQTGELSGTLRQTGNFTFVVSARDGNDPSLPPDRDVNAAEDRKTFNVSVGLGDPHVLPQVLPQGAYRESFAHQVDVAGGTAPYTFELVAPGVGAPAPHGLPAGIFLSPTGLVSGFPTQGGQTWTFGVKVKDSNNVSDQRDLSISVVVKPLIILGGALPDAAYGSVYASQLLLASPGGGAPYAWSQAPLDPMNFPGETDLTTIGFGISASGLISSGSVSALGTFDFRARVVDEAGQVDERAFSLHAVSSPVLTKITPNKSTASGPFVVTGSNFMPGAILIFNPGPNETTVTPPNLVWNSATQMTFSTAPAPPGKGGPVPVRIKNPDNGMYTRGAAFAFPVSTVAFGAKGGVSSNLSSTGLWAGDLNGDGFAEVVHTGASGVATYTGGPTSNVGGLHYWVNNQNLTFTQSALPSGSGNFYDVQFADMNKDGKTDIVALGQTSVYTWINGSPAGTFGTPVVSTLAGTDNYPSEMALGDIDGDGVLDMAYTISSYYSTGTTINYYGRVYTMKGTLGGNFGSYTASQTGFNYTIGLQGVALGDVNGDNKAEAMVTSAYYSSSGYPSVWIGTIAGPGSVSWSGRNNTTKTWWTGTCVACADFLGIGSNQVLHSWCQDSPDAGTGAACTGIGYSELHVLSGTNATTDTKVTGPPNEPMYKCIGVGDIDGDNKADFGVSVWSGQLYIYRGQTVAANTAADIKLDIRVGTPVVASGMSGPVAFGDLNGDGMDDVLVCNSYWNQDNQNSSYYSICLAGDGTPKGFTYWLNTSN